MMLMQNHEKLCKALNINIDFITNTDIFIRLTLPRLRKLAKKKAKISIKALRGESVNSHDLLSSLKTPTIKGTVN